MSSERQDPAAELVEVLRGYPEVPEGQRTEVLSQAAGLLVDLREQFTHNGRPDYSGKSAEYRAAYASVFSQAGLSEEDERSVKSTVRYHVSTKLHDRLTADQLAEYGVNARPIRSRESSRSRVTAADLLAAMAATDDPEAETRRILRYSLRALRMLSPNALARPELRDEAAECLREIADTATTMAERLSDQDK